MSWYQVKGNDTDTVLSSRVRLARNLSGYCFAEKLSEKDAKEVIQKIADALTDKGFTRTDFDDISPMEAESFVEQHLTSLDFARKKGPHTLFSNENKSVYLMACEEDHIRLQCILPGLALQDAFRFANEYDDILDEALDFAYDEKLGYLTHCPTNLGTGMRASVMLFLPALTAGGYISSLSHQLAKIGLTMRGIYGEGTESRGCLYQISNQVTMGLSESEILHKLEDFVQNIVERERSLRHELRKDGGVHFEDRVHRAEGTLRYASLLSSDEFFSLFADLKLGISEGLVTSLSDSTLNELLIDVQPATLTKQSQRKLQNSTERDLERARFIQKILEVKPK